MILPDWIKIKDMYNEQSIKDSIKFLDEFIEATMSQECVSINDESNLREASQHLKDYLYYRYGEKYD